MSPIYLSVLVVFLVVGQVTAQFQVAFLIIDTVIAWASTAYFTYDLLTDKTSDNIEQIQMTMNELSIELGTLASRADTKLDLMLITLLNHIDLAHEIIGKKEKLLDHLHAVDHFYDDSLKNTIGSFGNTTLLKFSESVLYDGDNLPKMLVEMHDIFSSGAHVGLSAGFIALVIRETTQNLPTDCDKIISPQQLLYYIYVQLIMAEMKSLVTLKNVYTIKWWLDETSYNYTSEFNDARMNFETRVKKYRDIFTEQLGLVPSHIRRCHVNVPKRGEDFFELEHFSRIQMLDPNIGQVYDAKDCYSLSLVQTHLHNAKAKLYDCVRSTDGVTVCPAGSGSPRDYLWWKDDHGVYSGSGRSCPAGEKWIGSHHQYWNGNYFYYRICFCSVDENKTRGDSYKAWHFDMNPQMSNIVDNMVVTGVQLVVRDRRIFVKIQQAKFSQSGMVYENSTWKDLDTYDSDGTHFWTYEEERQEPGPIRPDLKTLYLDDIILPANYIITGVAFVYFVGTHHYELQARATRFNFETGEMIPRTSYWCTYSGCRSETRARDYERERVVIDVGVADEPTRGVEFHYDPEVNKKITFQHTDMMKDAGQTTIPYIDMQPIHTQPPFPLTGIGLYYRGRKGFGGYIAPRIFTFDVSKRMKKLSNM